MTRPLAALLAFLCLAPSSLGDESRELVDVLERKDAKEELTQRLQRDAALTLSRLPLALDIVLAEDVPESAKGKRVTSGVSEAIATAMAAAPDPRLYLLAADRDPLPPIVLGVVRGASLVLERPVPTDQGAPDWEAFLIPLVRFQEDVAVRIAACEAIGKVTPTQGTASALLRALSDEGSGVASAARGVLQRLSKQNDKPGFDRWARTLPAGLAIVPELLRGLVSDGAVRRGPAAGWLVDRLRAEPTIALDELTRALEGVALQLEIEGAMAEDPTVSAAELAAVTNRVMGMVADAVVEAQVLRPFLDRAPEAVAPIAAGIARGIRLRATPYVTRENPAEWKERLRAERAARGEEEPTEPEEPEQQPDAPVEPREVPFAEELLDTLSVLAARPEPEVAIETFQAVSTLLTSLNDPWLELLTRPLENAEHGAVERAAWNALKHITGQDMPPSAPHWRRWWSDKASGVPR